jgi:hypothetical protein
MDEEILPDHPISVLSDSLTADSCSSLLMMRRVDTRKAMVNKAITTKNTQRSLPDSELLRIVTTALPKDHPLTAPATKLS